VRFNRHVPSCAREDDVLDLVAMGQWPERAEAELRAHAAGCDVCGDLAASASAIVELRDTGEATAVPDASVVWGRAQLRAREDAARRAAQPLHVAHGLTFAALTGLGLAWWGPGASWMQTWWAWFSGLLPRMPDSTAFSQWPVVSPEALPSLTTVLAIAAVWILIVPVALYLARLADR
jgi:hypothetical protein